MTGVSVDVPLSTYGAISSPMVAAMEQSWAAIQDGHPELPTVVTVLGAGSGNGPGLTLGHFAADCRGREWARVVGLLLVVAFALAAIATMTPASW